MEALFVPVGDDWYAIELTRVREVVARPVVQPLPTAPTTLLGAFNLHGEIVPLFDTAALLGLGRVPEVQFAVVVDTPIGSAALAASGAPRAAQLGEPMSAAETRGTVARYSAGTDVVVLLDVDALLVPIHIGSAV